MHVITHYPPLFRKIGPLKKIWTMRNEGRHRTYKRYSNVTSNRKNLPLSLALKDNLSWAFRLYQRKELPSPFTDVKVLKISVTQSNFYKHIEAIFAPDQLKHITLVERLTYNSIEYFTGSAFFHHINEELKPLQIRNLFCLNGVYKILASNLSIEEKNEHFQCYLVKQTNENFIVIEFKDLKYFPQHLHKISTGKLALRPPYSL